MAKVFAPTLLLSILFILFKNVFVTLEYFYFCLFLDTRFPLYLKMLLTLLWIAIDAKEKK